MKNPSPAGVKAWAKDYAETAFFCEQTSDHGKRLVAWTEDPEQMQKAFYALLEGFPKTVDVLLKISQGRGENDDKPLWSRYRGVVARDLVTHVVKNNESYTFTDGMHQLCVKQPGADHYLAFDEHGIFFVYSPTREDAEVFDSCGFDKRYAEPIYSMPHYQCTPPESEKLEIKFVTELGLEKVNSDLD